MSSPEAMAATPGQPASDLPFLLRIPAEIRVNIYNRIFQPYRIDSCLEVVDSETTAKSQANVLFHGVLLSCKKIHAETRDIAPEAVMFVAGPQASGTTPKIIFWDVQIRYIAATVKLALSHTILGLIDLNAIAAQIPKLKLIEIHTPTRFLGVFELNFLEFDRLRSTVDIWEAECDGELLHSPAPPQEEIEYVEPHTCRFANFVAEQAPELIVHVREMIVIEDGLGEESYVLVSQTPSELLRC